MTVEDPATSSQFNRITMGLMLLLLVGIYSSQGCDRRQDGGGVSDRGVAPTSTNEAAKSSSTDTTAKDIVGVGSDTEAPEADATPPADQTRAATNESDYGSSETFGEQIITIEEDELVSADDLAKPIALTLTPLHREEAGWVNRVSIDTYIVDEKQRLDLTPEDALAIISSDRGDLADNWRELVKGEIATKPDARKLPDRGKLNLMKLPAPPEARVVRFSKDAVDVMVLRQVGSYFWHQFHECVASFRIPRGQAIDERLGVAKLEKPHWSGVKIGQPRAEVVKVLGEPDGIRLSQADGQEYHYYLNEQISIEVQRGRVFEVKHNAANAFIEAMIKEQGKVLKF